MPDAVEHETTDAGLERVSISLEPAAWHGHAVETVWAAPLGGGRFRLRNVPFYAKGVSYDDVVTAHHSGSRLCVTGLAQRGGHSTYRVIISDQSSSEMWIGFWSRLQKLGCTYERATDHLLAIDVPPTTDLNAVYKALEEGDEAGVWDFEEGHVGHPV